MPQAPKHGSWLNMAESEWSVLTASAWIGALGRQIGLPTWHSNGSAPAINVKPEATGSFLPSMHGLN